MKYPWYERVALGSSLDQGDLIFDCPVLGWSETPVDVRKSAEAARILKTSVVYQRLDVVVMTQTCDLHQRKVNYVILCPHYPLDEYHEIWAASLQDQGQNPTEKSWKKYLKSITNGHCWHLSMINKEAEHRAEHRIVDFHEIFSIPRSALESWLTQQNMGRLRLCPPYREHLSQAFARFFMRVGLPTEIDRDW